MRDVSGVPTNATHTSLAGPRLHRESTMNSGVVHGAAPLHHLQVIAYRVHKYAGVGRTCVRDCDRPARSSATRLSISCPNRVPFGTMSKYHRTPSQVKGSSSAVAVKRHGVRMGESSRPGARQGHTLRSVRWAAVPERPAEVPVEFDGRPQGSPLGPARVRPRYATPVRSRAVQSPASAPLL